MINVTMINAEGSPSTFQASTLADANRRIGKRINEGNAPDQTWDLPIIAVYVFDTNLDQPVEYTPLLPLERWVW